MNNIGAGAFRRLRSAVVSCKEVFQSGLLFASFDSGIQFGEDDR